MPNKRSSRLYDHCYKTSNDHKAQKNSSCKIQTSRIWSVYKKGGNYNHELTIRFARFFINCIFLIGVMVFLLFYSYDEQLLINNDELEVSFLGDHYLIEGKSSISLYITIQNMEKLNLTEDSIVTHGFSYDNVHFCISEPGIGNGETVFCSIHFYGLTNNKEIEEKIIRVNLEDSFTIQVQPSMTFTTIEIVTLRSAIIFISCNILLTILTFFISDGKDRKIIFWVDSFILGWVSCSCFIDAIQYNLSVRLDILILLLITGGFLYYLLLAKKVLANIGYTFFIIVLSTCSIAYFSYIFSWYYLHNSSEDLFTTVAFQNIILPVISPESYDLSSSYFMRRVNEQLAYIEFSFRYFFMFPPDEYYGWIAIFQFIMGKLYEMVMLGSIANLVLRYIRYPKASRGHSKQTGSSLHR